MEATLAELERVQRTMGTLLQIATSVYGADHKYRFKPKYYPYTEPSVGMDIQCAVCHAKDENCRACGGASGRWLGSTAGTGGAGRVGLAAHCAAAVLPRARLRGGARVAQP